MWRGGNARLTVAEGIVAVLTIPVTEANVPTVICRNPAAVIDYGKENETDHGNNLDYPKREFDYRTGFVNILSYFGLVWLPSP